MARIDMTISDDKEKDKPAVGIGASVKKPTARRGAGAFNVSEEKVSSVHVARIIYSNPYQPRLEIPEDELRELADTIKEHGLMQPIIIRPYKDHFQVVAGHRRLEAHKLLEAETIDALVREISDEEMMYQVAIENIQRKDLSPIEIGVYLSSLIGKEWGDARSIAKKLGLSDSYVSRYLGLMKLDPEVVNIVSRKEYTNIKVLNRLLKFESSRQVIALNHIIDKEMPTEEALTYLDSISGKKNTKREFVVIKTAVGDVKMKNNIYLIEIDKEQLSENQINSLNEFLKTIQ